ncbi:F-box and associated interaction domains-containing protein isoform 2 [Tripterygium wilfordii]|uniref:F-box and associated interaction domains-containing protein isoform 2 n=1 Tax=Tripterygium wilfordii TaxID=458696 RepID=A0A7J7E210_TRIWF|nr:F-box and associated interaction domains-containing protein isoform 2 [Tripterygium wilfordii]
MLHWRARVGETHGFRASRGVAPWIISAKDLCLYDHNANFEFWNPATRELKSPPMFSVQHPPDSKPHIPRVVGFGFDQKTNDYKVLRSVVYNNHTSSCYSWPYQIELYSLKSDSWREIHTKVDIHFFILYFDQVYKDGVCYWLTYWEGNFTLMSLCMAEETFQEVPMPDIYVTHLSRLSIFSGFLSVIMCSKDYMALDD